ncbi:hypothetical protein OY671_012341, partial [Metschnikowia pulcherrima]
HPANARGYFLPISASSPISPRGRRLRKAFSRPAVSMPSIPKASPIRQRSPQLSNRPAQPSSASARPTRSMPRVPRSARKPVTTPSQSMSIWQAGPENSKQRCVSSASANSSSQEAMPSRCSRRPTN